MRLYGQMVYLAFFFFEMYYDYGKVYTFAEVINPKNEKIMRKLLALTAIFACMFVFASCKEDEEELQSAQYTLQAWFDADFTNIYIYEYNQQGEKIKTNTLYSLKRNETKTYTSEKGCEKVHVYAQSWANYIVDNEYIVEKYDYITVGEKNNILLNPASVISEEEYNFYTR